MIYVFLIFLLIVLLTNKWFRNLKYQKFQGPSPWLSFPLIGHGYLLAKDPVKGLFKAYNKYGNMFRLDLGNIPTIWLCSSQVVREAYSKDEFCGRFFNEMPTFQAACRKDRQGKPLWTLVGGEGPLWEEQKKYATKSLSDLGMGKRDSMQDIIEQEAEDIVKVLKEKQGIPIKNENLFIYSTNNVVWRTITGKKTLQDSTDLKYLTEKMMNVSKTLDPSQPSSLLQMNSIHFTRFLQKLGLPNFVDSQREVTDFLSTEVENSTAYENGNYIEKALFVRDEDISHGRNTFLSGPNYHGYIVGHMNDMLFGGTETTSSAMEWMMLYLIKYPECQDRMFEEISQITGGNGRNICLNDQPKAHFCNSFIEETIRHSPLTTLTAPHKVLADGTLNGYDIPKGTQLVFFIYAVHRDPNNFPNPNEFKPDRFLNDSGNFVKDSNVFLFGPGKRRCPGELLAKAEIFLYITAIVQHFKVRAKIDPKQLSTNYIPRFVMAPEPYEFFVQARVE